MAGRPLPLLCLTGEESDVSSPIKAGSRDRYIVEVRAENRVAVRRRGWSGRVRPDMSRHDQLSALTGQLPSSLCSFYVEI